MSAQPNDPAATLAALEAVIAREAARRRVLKCGARPRPRPAADLDGEQAADDRAQRKQATP